VGLLLRCGLFRRCYFSLPSGCLVLMAANSIGSQAVWLEQGYELEFLGKATFVPGLWVASLLFFVVNVWLLGIIVGDIRPRGGSGVRSTR